MGREVNFGTQNRLLDTILEHTLALELLVSFFLGAALLACCGVGGAALLTWGEAVVLRALAAAAAAAGADGGGMARGFWAGAPWTWPCGGCPGI